MRKISKVKLTVVLILVISLILTYFIMFFYINNLYPQSERIIYEFGKTFVVQNAEFTITDADLLKKDDIEKDAGMVEILEDNSGYLSEKDLNLVLVDMFIKNPTKETIYLDLTAFHFESGAFSLQFYFPLMIYYNDCGMYIELNGEEEKNIKVPIPISASQFLNYNIENIQDRNYYFVCSLYPKKIMAEVKFNKFDSI